MYFFPVLLKAEYSGPTSETIDGRKCIGGDAPASVSGKNFISGKHVQPWEVTGMNAPYGTIAPDFQAEALHQGEVKKIRLMDYRGRWVLLLFYPGDFTWV